jgi:hypothetical protein
MEEIKQEGRSIGSIEIQSDEEEEKNDRFNGVQTDRNLLSISHDHHQYNNFDDLAANLKL